MGFGRIGLRRGGNGREVGEIVEMGSVEKTKKKKKKQQQDFDFYRSWFDDDALINLAVNLILTTPSVGPTAQFSSLKRVHVGLASFVSKGLAGLTHRFEIILI